MESQEKTSIAKGLLSFGIFASNKQLVLVKNEILKLKNYTGKMLVKLFIPVISICIFGFIIKITLETTYKTLIIAFGKIFIFNLIFITLFVIVRSLIVARLQVSTNALNLRLLLRYIYAQTIDFHRSDSIVKMSIDRMRL
jgi:hypothetical protein